MASKNKNRNKDNNYRYQIDAYSLLSDIFLQGFVAITKEEALKKVLELESDKFDVIRVVIKLS